VADVPFGRSSPIVAGNRIYLTAIDDGAFVTMALDRATGKTLWKSAVKHAREETHHQDTDAATITPVTDGKKVYAFFQEFGIVSYDKRGKERWTQEMGPFRKFYGIAEPRRERLARSRRRRHRAGLDDARQGGVEGPLGGLRHST
jgi:outer membrane protein assembly factor BamB